MNIHKLYEVPVDSYGDVRTLVRGLPYQCPDDWEEVLDSLDENSNLYLIKEPDNPKDSLAIAAYLDDRRVGYVAASDNEMIWPYLTDEKMPCTFIERFEASFKVSFNNPLLTTKETEKIMKRSQFNPDFYMDYALKKEEMTDFTIKKSTFAKIDEITTELFTFVRRKLFHSMELFSYLKQYTPYGKQINDWGEYETLIKVFVIKDLGRIYKGLNHSINFDTAEGKALYLYMDKEVGEDTDIPYDSFSLICNPNPPIEAAVKMRALLERQLKAFYECDIELWTISDFMIHSFLKAVDSELAKRYLEIMHQFELFVKGTNDKKSSLPSTSSKATSFAIDNFFPIWGISLGKTTWEQAEEMGYAVKKWDNCSVREMRVDNARFRDWYCQGIITSVLMYEDDGDLPLSWKSKGFSWDNSYDEWIEVFSRLDFKITVTEEPRQHEENDNMMLKANFEAVSPDGLLKFELAFNHGQNGYLTSSPKTLYSIEASLLSPIEKYEDDGDFLPYWKSKGFSWDNSYDDWKEVFSRLDFKITVTEQPKQYEDDDDIILKAKFDALSPDGMVKFVLEFDCGYNGYLTSSPNTLFLISMIYNGCNEDHGTVL